jgi:hypothetical protein
MLFELDGVSLEEAKNIHAKVAVKLPITTRLVKRRFVEIN